MRPTRVAQRGLRVEHRTHDLRLAEHRGCEDVHARAVLEQVLGDVAPSDVRRRAESRFPISPTPVPRGVDDRRLLLEQLLHDAEVPVRLENELGDELRLDRQRLLVGHALTSSFSFFASSMTFCAICEGTSS